MPGATKTRGKRALEDADTNVPLNDRQAKRASLEKGDDTVRKPTNEKSGTNPRKGRSKNAENSNASEGDIENRAFRWEMPAEDDKDPENPKGLRGPDGNLQTPDILPLEAEAALDAALVPGGYTTLDGTPGRVYTLGNDSWRLENHEWLKKHARKLNGSKYLWGDKSPDGYATGSKIGPLISVDFSAVASDDEKRAVKELDKDLLKDEEPGASERFQKELEREGRAKKPTDWVCMCRPGWDVDDVTDEGGMESGSEDEPAEREDGCEKGHHRAGYLADDFPKHKWVFTKRGQQWCKYWMIEQAKRDQDRFDLYVYNDYTGYGIHEIIENQIQCFKVKFVTKTPNIMMLWFQFEAMALFCSYDWMPLWMIDDSEGLSELVQLQGRLVLSFVQFLIQQDLFKNDSPICNLGLVLSLWVRYFRVQTHPDLPQDSRRWYQELVRLADQHGIEMNIPCTIGKLCEEIRENASTEDDDSHGSDEEDSEGEGVIRVAPKDETPSKKWGLIRHFADYAKKYRRGWTQGKIGGDAYDLTKMPKAERERRSLLN